MISYAPSDCWIIVDFAGDKQSEYLPMYPDEVSDSQSAIWSSTQILGRSSPLAAYTGTDARKISFSMTLHREMLGSNNIDKINHILVLLKRALYPEYQSPGLIPPRIRVVLGQLAVEGVLENVSFNWKKPIVDGFYSVCDVSVNITGYTSGISTNISSSSIGVAHSTGNSYNPYNPEDVDVNDRPTKNW